MNFESAASASTEADIDKKNSRPDHTVAGTPACLASQVHNIRNNQFTLEDTNLNSAGIGYDQSQYLKSKWLKDLIRYSPESVKKAHFSR